MSQGISTGHIDKVFDEVSKVLENGFLDSSERNNGLLLRLVGYAGAHPVLPSVLLTGVSVALILVGTFASIRGIPTTALPPTNEHYLFDPTDNDLEHECEIYRKGEQKDDDEEISVSHGILMPIYSTFSLLSLYALIKYVDIKWQQLLMKSLQWLVLLTSFPAHLTTYQYLFNATIRQLRLQSLKCNPRYRFTLSDDNDTINREGYVENFTYFDSLNLVHPAMHLIKKDSDRTMYARELRAPSVIESSKQIANLYLSQISIVSLVLSCVMLFVQLKWRNSWIVDNLSGMNLAIYGIVTLQFANLKSAFVSLLLFFLYDIFFVFGNDVMLTVATSTQLPGKLMLPTSVDPNTQMLRFSLLGLGDIVIPGLLVSLCYRFDIWKWHQLNVDEEFHLKRWSYMGPYTCAAVVSYVSGLALCSAVLHRYHVAQPALLYLLPTMLMSIAVLSAARSELGEFWNFKYGKIELGPLENTGTADPSDSQNQVDQDSLTDVHEHNDTERIISLSDFESELADTDEDPDYTGVDALMDSDGEAEADDDDDANDDDYNENSHLEFELELCLPSSPTTSGWDQLQRAMQDDQDEDEDQDLDFEYPLEEESDSA